jgi:adenylylsulfate kinase
MGLPGTGKTTLAKALKKELVSAHFEADVIRDIFNDWNFSPENRLIQAGRMRGLCELANNDFVIADFVCPTIETRKIFDADFSIWMDTDNQDHEQYEDTNALFEVPLLYDYRVTNKGDSVEKTCKTIVEML